MTKEVIVILPTCNRYQMARLVAAKILSPTLAIIEISGKGSYNLPGWRDPKADDLEYVDTLFSDRFYGEIPAQEMRSRLWSCLAARKGKIAALVVLGWSNPEAVAAIAWAMGNDVAIIGLSETQAIDEPRIFWKELVKRQIVGCFSAALVGGSPHREYMMQLGLPADHVFLGYDAVDNSYFADKVAEVRNQLPAPRFFLASARFVEKKNLPRLIEAYARYRTLCETTSREPRAGSQQSEFQVSDLRPPTSDLWSLVLLGDGELRPAICSQIQALGLQDHVLLPGFKQYPELPTYYGMASAMILPSISETWGLVVNEAMASGLPVLVSNRCGCAQDLVQESVNGFTFDPYNVEQMAQQMVRVWSMEPGARSKMGDASRQIISVWGPERFAQGLAAAVEKAVACGPVKPTLLQRLILKALLAR